MDFSQALKELKNGKAIKIRGDKGYYTLNNDNNIIYYDGAGGQATRCSIDVDAILSDKWETSGYKQENIKYSNGSDEIKMIEEKCCFWEEQCKNTIDILKDRVNKIGELKKEIEKYKAEKFYLEGQISILREMLGK